MGARILIRDDKELAELLAECLKSEGVKILTKTRAVKFSQQNGSTDLH